MLAVASSTSASATRTGPAAPAAPIDRLIEDDCGPPQVTRLDVVPRGGPLPGADRDLGQVVGGGHVAPGPGGRHGGPGHSDLPPAGGRVLQALHERQRELRLLPPSDRLKRQARGPAHEVVEPGQGVEFLFPGDDQGVARLGQLDFGAEDVVEIDDAGIAAGAHVLQGRLRAADRLLPDRPRCAGQQDLLVRQGDVEGDRLPGSLVPQRGDLCLKHGLMVSARGAPEVVQSPLDLEGYCLSESLFEKAECRHRATKPLPELALVAVSREASPAADPCRRSNVTWGVPSRAIQWVSLLDANPEPTLYDFRQSIRRERSRHADPQPALAVPRLAHSTA